MQLRPYQEEAANRTLKSWTQYDRLLGVAATGAGKTVIAAHIIHTRMPEGPALFIAHREELLNQAIEKLKWVTGISASREQATSRASLSDAVVVASVQSLHAARLERWPPDQGITATPDRSDQRSLGEIFEEIAFEIELPQLIEDGYLAPILVETLPLKIDLAGRRTGQSW